jgi:hypothetical protein
MATDGENRYFGPTSSQEFVNGLYSPFFGHQLVAGRRNVLMARSVS